MGGKKCARSEKGRLTETVWSKNLFSKNSVCRLDRSDFLGNLDVDENLEVRDFDEKLFLGSLLGCAGGLGVFDRLRLVYF